MDPILQVSGVSYGYHGEKNALRQIDLTLNKAERVVLLGSNGAGKSTLFLLLNGVLTPDSGEILLHGVPAGRREKELRNLRRAVGLVFQDPDDQLLGATVEREISFGPMNLGLPPQQVRQAIDDAVVAMDLQDLRNRPPQYLSGGEKKRVSIADILAMQPEVILFDEPTASLDPSHTALLEETLEDLHQQDLSLVVSTHDVGFAWRWADRAVVLAGGERLADGPVEDIFADDALLKRAGLHKPAVFDLAQTLFPSLPRKDYPRTVGALKSMISGEKP